MKVFLGSQDIWGVV